MTTTPCQSKSGTAAIGARSGLALGCRRNRGVVIIIVQAVSHGASHHVSWKEDEEFMKLHYEALVNVPVRVVLLHLRKRELRLGIDNDPISPFENSYLQTFPSFTPHADDPQTGGVFDPKITGRHSWWQARLVGLSLSTPDQLLAVRYSQSGESQREPPMIPIDENRDPFELWNNTDPADHERVSPGGTAYPRDRGRRGFALFQNEFETEVKAFHEEHGLYPKLMMVISVSTQRPEYSYQNANNVSRSSICSLGLDNLPDRFDRARSFWDEDANREVFTHLAARTALGDAMRSIRDKYDVRSEFSEYGEFPDFNELGDDGRRGIFSRDGRKFREVGERLKRALTIDGPLPGAPEHFAVPWPEVTP